jgi:hypothetical protein
MQAQAMVYLDLQNLKTGSVQPIEIYLASDYGLDFDLRDADGQDDPMTHRGVWYLGGVAPPSFTVTLPPESTIRIRADSRRSTSRPGLSLWIPRAEGPWIIPPDATKDYFLSATFSPPTNHPDTVGHRLWQGTLQLPKVKIPVDKIKSNP